MKKLYFLCLFFSYIGIAQNVTITKVIEAGCASPFVKTVELYVDGTVDFSTDVVLNFMQNGGAWADNQIDVSALGVQTDAFIYIVRDIPLMQAEFPSTTFDETNTIIEPSLATNGDDGYQVVLNGVVVSQFGRTETDADLDTESDWNHNDTVAIRISGIADIGVWDPTQWEIRPEDDLDSHTSCQNEATTNLETYFASLGSTYPLGSGSGWTPTGDVCTTALASTSVSCDAFTIGDANDTYTATVDFVGGNVGTTFTITANAGTVSGDNPSSVETGTITVSNIPEGTDLDITVSDLGDGGVCELTANVTSPICIPLVLNEMHFDPANDLSGDANGDGTRDAAQDEFVEFFNNSNSALDLSSYTISDASQVRHIFPAGTIVPANGVIVVFGGGTPTGTFGGAIVQTASEGQLNLNNASDAVIVANPDNRIAINFDSSSVSISFGENQSVTRNPDITGDFVLHTDANSELLFSPGLRVNGETLSIEDVAQTNFKLYPNPATNGSVTILSNLQGDKDVEIYDLNGRRVLNTISTNGMIDVQSLSQGLYLVKVTVDTITQTKKLIIK